MKDEENEKNKKYETILLERIENKIGLLAEGQSALREKVDSMETKVDSLVEDMDYVKSTLADNKERFKETADKTVIDDHERRISALENSALAEA